MNVLSMPDVPKPASMGATGHRQGRGKRVALSYLGQRPEKRIQHTVGFRPFFNLPHDFKGAHMSRFIEALNEFGERSLWRSCRKSGKDQRKAPCQERSHECRISVFCGKDCARHGNPWPHVTASFMSGALAESFDLIVGVEVPRNDCLSVFQGDL